MDPRHQQTESRASRVLSLLLAVPILVVAAAILAVVLPFLVVRAGLHRVVGARLDSRFRRQLASRGSPAILVYSDSPHWKDYFEAEVLPRLGGRATVLNWSQRKTWRKERSLPVRVYEHHRPDREFNPYALVFPPRGAPVRISFFLAFRDLRHGKPQPLERAMATFWAELEKAVDAWGTSAGAGT